MRDITELPHDLFLLVASHLPPSTCIVCRSVSRQWLAAFTNDATSQLLLRWHYPRCREMRLAAAAATLTKTASCERLSRDVDPEIMSFVRMQEKPGAWAATFTDVTRRYCNLRKGRPAAVVKLDQVGPNTDENFRSSFYGVAPWNRFLRLESKTSNFHYPDPAWSFSQEDGVLVFPGGHIRGAPGLCDGYIYQALDPATNERVAVPFDVRQKHIRRVRLAEAVLIFEWAQWAAYHQLNNQEVVHRHFVTAFDVARTRSATEDGDKPAFSIKFRSEWKLHFLGLPLNRSDRFHSAHTSNHYAAYFWQPNRSLYQDDPIEQIAVWDISTPSPFRPSENLNGEARPTPGRAQTTPTGLWRGFNPLPSVRSNGASDSEAADSKTQEDPPLAEAPAGPRVIRRMAWRELDFYGLRQRATPQVRGLALDDCNLYITEEEHRWADGQHSSLNPPRLHEVRCTGIPIVPTPEAVCQLTNKRLRRHDNTATPETPYSTTQGPVFGPMWFNCCGADESPNMNFCNHTSNRAHIEIPIKPLIGSDEISEFIRDRRQARIFSWYWMLGREKRYAPCWRHEDFPYLTVTEMLDGDAGVRITARHCFMLENLSVHVRPGKISVDGPTTPQNYRDDDWRSERSDKAKQWRPLNDIPDTRSGEVQFADDLWPELMAKGHIAGDERFILGEDRSGKITIVKF